MMFIANKGFSLKEVEGIVNQGGHEEHYHYAYSVVDEKGVVTISVDTFAMLSLSVETNLGQRGKMLSGSKLAYSNKVPNNLVVFNANVCVKEGKIWYGDIDVTMSKDKLSSIAKDSGKEIYVLYESDARFENEDSPKLEKAAVIFYPDGSIKIDKRLQNYYTL